MSWWDAKALTGFATQALKTAQKRIDKVLDIREEEEGSHQGGQARLYLYRNILLTCKLDYTLVCHLSASGVWATDKHVAV